MEGINRLFLQAVVSINLAELVVSQMNERQLQSFEKCRMIAAKLNSRKTAINIFYEIEGSRFHNCIQLNIQ